MLIVDAEVQVKTKFVEYNFKQQLVLKLFLKTILTSVSVLINAIVRFDKNHETLMFVVWQ